MSIFSKVSNKAPKLNKFDLSHERKMSLNMGKLIPIMLEEIVPGDKFRVNTEIMLRMAPMLAPVMHRVNVYTHYFFVPNRLIWDEFENFITGGPDGDLEPVAPYVICNQVNVSSGLFAKGTLADYFGIPTTESTGVVQTTMGLSALPFRAYNMIYNEYYRDQNLEDAVNYGGHGSGQVSAFPAIANLMGLKDRAWEKDYFTSALPWTQRGEQVLMPIYGSGSVTYMPESKFRDSLGNPLSGAVTGNPGPGIVGDMLVGGTFGQVQNIDEVLVENSEVTINDLRRSIKLQEWLEKNARGGARYIEQILSHFGVVSSDARLQRPEYLGGGKSPVVISEVLSTFQGTGEGDAPQGNMAGHGISVGNTNGFNKRFEEHGFVVGIMSVLPRTNYQQGVDRKWSRQNKFDWYWPEFANLGEQAVYNHEVYYKATELHDTWSNFGYQSRYAEYKFGKSSVHGDFRDNLAYWHLGRIFEDQPQLNAAFVKSDPSQRIFAVEDPDVHKLYCQLYNKIDALRPMPYFGTPSL